MRPSELFRPSAREVFQPQDVLALMLSVIERESDTAVELLASRLSDPGPRPQPGR